MSTTLWTLSERSTLLTSSKVNSISTWEITWLPTQLNMGNIWQKLLKSMPIIRPLTPSNTSEFTEEQALNALKRLLLSIGKNILEWVVDMEQLTHNFSSNTLYALIFYNKVGALLKNVDIKNIYPLDHGCIWGGQLTAYNLTNNIYISQVSVEV